MKWYLVKTIHGKEATAEQKLSEQGFEIYNPTVDIEKLRNRKVTVVVESLFRGYLFIRFDADTTNTMPIRSTKGVQAPGLIRFGEHIAVVPDRIITTLKESAPDKISTLPKKGQEIHIISGPFAGLEAIYKQADGDSRSLILINLLNTQQEVRIFNDQFK